MPERELTRVPVDDVEAEARDDHDQAVEHDLLHVFRCQAGEEEGFQEDIGDGRRQ